MISKFGGAALEDATAIRRAADLVVPPAVVVVSAMAGITDALLHRDATTLERVATRHVAVLAELASDDRDAARELAQVHRSLAHALAGDDGSPLSQDAILSHGERAAVVLVAATLRRWGHVARGFDAAAAGIACTGRPGHARPAPDLADRVRAAIGHHVAAGILPVVTGFYGDQDGRPTVFGRGGSDYVASLVGAALGAEAVDLWKDVPGFLTADPRLVPAARLVPELDYQEAAELAYFGAKILHPRAVEPLAGPRIPLRIRSFLDPDAPGTTIREGADHAPELVRSAASRGGLAVLRLTGPDMGHTPGIARRVFDALGDADVNVLNMANSQATFALLITEDDADAALAAVTPLVGSGIQAVDLLRDRALVCVVGRGLGETPGSAARILQAVADRHVNIEMISLGASEIAIDFIVPGNQREAALAGLHESFLAAPVTA